MQLAWRRVAARGAAAARRSVHSSRTVLTKTQTCSARRSAVSSSSFSRVNGAVRFETSGRFQELADEEKQPKDDEETAEGGVEAADAADEDDEGEDGSIEVEEAIDINTGGVEENEELDELVMDLFMENPLLWTPETLAKKFQLSKARVEANIWLKRMEREMTPEEFKAKVQEAKEKAQKDMDERQKKIKDAEASGNTKELARLKKNARREQDATKPDEELTPEQEAVLMGHDEEAFRNPDFFFLSDEFEGYPPLVRRMGKHGHTDKLYPEEALQLQKMAGNNKITLQKSFANPENSKTKSKFVLAVRDTTTKKKHLLVRDESRTLRLAKDDEVLPRTWVRRPAYFRGLAKELA